MSKNKLMYKIKEKKAKIAIVGMGYVGLPTAAVLANIGFQVTGIDINSEIVNAVSQSKTHTNEPGLDNLISKARDLGKLNARKRGLQVLTDADIMVICVQTPLDKDGKPNLTYLEAACKEVAKVLTKEKLVAIQSTVLPGTTKNLIISCLEEQSGLKCGADFWLIYCPERMAPGTGIEDLLTNPRVIGGYNSESVRLGAELFRLVTKGDLLLTDLRSAEIAKLAENTFRYVNIAFANELALICEEVGVDVGEVINLANTHPRVNIHTPGCGVGGPCLSKDTNFLLYSTKVKSSRSGVISASKRINEYMPRYFSKRIVDAIKKVGKRVENAKIAVLGTAYKAQVNDARNSPAEHIINTLMTSGAEIVVYDPYCDESFGARKVEDIIKAVKGADCMVVTANHKVFYKLELPKIKALMKENPIIADGRRVISSVEARRQGFIYVAIGYDARPSG